MTWELSLTFEGPQEVAMAAESTPLLPDDDGVACIEMVTPLEQGAKYYSRMIVTNAAECAASISNGFIVDRTPPMPGTVGLYLELPPLFDQQPSFHSVTDVSLFLNVDEFQDVEAGIES